MRDLDEKAIENTQVCLIFWHNTMFTGILFEKKILSKYLLNGL